MLGLKYQSQLGIGFEFATCEQKGSLACGAVITGGRMSICGEGGWAPDTHTGAPRYEGKWRDRRERGRQWAADSGGQQTVVHSLHVHDGRARVVARSRCLINLLQMNQQIDGQSVNDSDPETEPPQPRKKDMRD